MTENSHSFRTFDDVSAWLDQVEAAAAVTSPSGFSPGVALAHCAQSLEMQCTGYPSMKPTLLRRTVGVMVRNRFIAKGAMSHEVNQPIPGAPQLGEVSAEEGVARLRTAMQSFKDHRGGLAEHFVFGQVDKITAEMLQSMHIANHADQLVLI